MDLEKVLEEVKIKGMRAETSTFLIKQEHRQEIKILKE